MKKLNAINPSKNAYTIGRVGSLNLSENTTKSAIKIDGITVRLNVSASIT